jgi:hypothetical protein
LNLTPNTSEGELDEQLPDGQLPVKAKIEAKEEEEEDDDDDEEEVEDSPDNKEQSSAKTKPRVFGLSFLAIFMLLLLIVVIVVTPLLFAAEATPEGILSFWGEVLQTVIFPPEEGSELF